MLARLLKVAQQKDKLEVQTQSQPELLGPKISARSMIPSSASLLGIAKTTILSLIQEN